MKSSSTRGNLGASDYRIESQQQEGLLGTRWVVQSKATGIRHVADLLEPGDDDLLRSLCENALRTRGWTTSTAVANVVDAGWLPDGTYFHVIEMSPQSRSYFERERLSEAQLLSIATSLVDGLMHMHKKELVHGLLTPRSIYDDNERAIIGDLWWAHNADGQPLYGALKVFFPRIIPEFALPFVSPEVSRGESPKREADLYSLGAVMLYLLTGKTPRALSLSHTGDQPTSIDNAVLRQVKVVCPDVSDMTCATIAKLLTDDPFERLSIFALEAVLQEAISRAAVR